MINPLTFSLFINYCHCLLTTFFTRLCLPFNVLNSSKFAYFVKHYQFVIVCVCVCVPMCILCLSVYMCVRVCAASHFSCIFFNFHCSLDNSFYSNHPLVNNSSMIDNQCQVDLICNIIVTLMQSGGQVCHPDFNNIW